MQGPDHQTHHKRMKINNSRCMLHHEHARVLIPFGDATMVYPWTHIFLLIGDASPREKGNHHWGACEVVCGLEENHSSPKTQYTLGS
jgi:hypothetical protein